MASLPESPLAPHAPDLHGSDSYPRLQVDKPSQLENCLVLLNSENIVISKTNGSLQRKVRNGSSVRRQIITDNRQRAPISDNHVRCAHCAKSIHDEAVCVSFNTEDLALAVLRDWEGRAVRAVVVEETIQSGPVHDDVLTIEHP